MKIDYDPIDDILRIVFNDILVEESDEINPGYIVDYDINGNIVGLEVLNASKRIEKPNSIEYAKAASFAMSS